MNWCGKVAVVDAVVVVADNMTVLDDSNFGFGFDLAKIFGTTSEHFLLGLKTNKMLTRLTTFLPKNIFSKIC
jgi:hypothetical protein